MYKKGRNASTPTSGSNSTAPPKSSPSSEGSNSSMSGGYKSMINIGAQGQQPKLVASSSSMKEKTATPVKKKDEEKVEDSPHPVPPAILKKRDSQITKDLMISYSHSDKEMMLKVRDALQDNGISVWVDVSGLQAGVDFLSKIGQAIIDCKLFLSLLSKASVKSKYCQDELALAYVSNRSIFPVTLDEPAELKPMMDTGMKLQLARYEWTNMGRDPSKFKESFESLLAKLKDELISQQADKKEAEAVVKSEDVKKPSPDKPELHRQDTRHKLNIKRKKRSGTELGVEMMGPDVFWKENFGNKTEIEWPKFVEVFDTVFKSQLDQMLGADEIEWLHGILARELEVEEDILYQFSLMGKFRSAAVIDALRDLLGDLDANVRAVATISLARTEAKDPVTIKFLMKTLNDKDRLVREAGCLALGHLQAKQSVNKLLHMWRNDVISHVREAANVALSQIGGDEVEKAMRVTKVLADEIRQLTTE